MRIDPRINDVREFEADKLLIQNCFRPNDIVKAKVIGISEAIRFQEGILLSTAQNDLGVILAKSMSFAELMVPLSWEEMQCPRSKIIEKRKVAKPGAAWHVFLLNTSLA